MTDPAPCRYDTLVGAQLTPEGKAVLLDISGRSATVALMRFETWDIWYDYLDLIWDAHGVTNSTRDDPTPEITPHLSPTVNGLLYRDLHGFSLDSVMFAYVVTQDHEEYLEFERLLHELNPGHPSPDCAGDHNG